MVALIVLAGMLDALRQADAKVSAIAWRLQTANVASCPHVVPLAGFSIETLDQYQVAERPEATAQLGLRDRPQVSAVAPDSAAAKAGLKVGDEILAVNDVSTPRARGRRPSYDATAATAAAVAQALATPPAKLTLADRTLTLTGDAGCASEVQLVPETQLDASADGHYGNKIITTSGGGALASDDGAAIARARFLSTQAREPAAHYEHETYGYNYRLSNVCAAIGVGQLAVLADRVAARRAIFDGYRERLGDMAGIRFVDEPEGMRANRWLTTISIDPVSAGFDRFAAQAALERENIESRPLWKPMHLQPVFREARAVGGRSAARAFEQGLCLPSGSAMTLSDIDRVCEFLQRLQA